MIGEKWISNSKKFKCAVFNKFHLIDIHKNGMKSIPRQNLSNVGVN